MPIHTGQDKNGKFYQWGKTGKKYYFKPEDKQSKQRALNKAKKQQTAIYSSGWKGDTMKLIKVKKGDAQDSFDSLVDEICVTTKWFGKRNYFVYFTYLNDNLSVVVRGPETLSIHATDGIADAKIALRDMKECQKDLEQAISYAEKTEKEFRKRLKELGK